MSDSCKQTICEKAKKFISVKFVGYLVALLVLLLVSVYGELGAALVSGVCGLYAALVAGNAAGKHIRSSAVIEEAKAKVHLIINGRGGEPPDG